MSTSPRPNLLPVAAFVSLLVLLLGATGLFSLHLTNAKTAADLARLDETERHLLLALRTRAAFKTQVQEWKNILLRARDPKDLDAYRARFEKEETAVREGLDALARDFAAAHPGAMIKSADLSGQHARLGETYRATLAAFVPSEPDAAFHADAAVRGIDRPLAEQLDTLATAVEQAAAAELKAMGERAAARYEALRRITWIAAGLAVLASLWLCFRATRLAV